MTRNIFIVLLGASLFCSCRATKKIQSAIVKKDTVTVVAPPLDTGHEDSMAVIREHFSQLEKNRIDFASFSGKLDVDYEETGGRKLNVNAELRMYRDSVIWVRITAIFGIEGLRAYITRDSVKILDRQNKIYIARSVAYLQEIAALPLDLPSLQDLLIGNPVFLTPDISSFSKSPGSISLHGANSLFRMLITMGEPDKILRSTKLDDLDEQRNRTSYLTWGDYENKKGVTFPQKRSISVAEKKTLEIKLNYKQYEFNETLSFPFSVPKNYKAE
ncbi:MAG: DUF4292 domain-containing protein [Sphingobacteriales bacterium]|nr:DUF4292 domain-containing protein [Sphingobacteriales bacterium]